MNRIYIVQRHYDHDGETLLFLTLDYNKALEYFHAKCKKDRHSGYGELVTDEVDYKEYRTSCSTSLELMAYELDLEIQTF